MAMGFNAEYEVKEAAAADLNSAQNTSLLSFYMPSGGILRRFGVVSEAAAGLLAPSVLKASYSEDGGATYTDITGATLSSGARSRGVPVYRTLDISGARIPEGALVAIRVSTAAGGVSTGRVWAEVAREPFAGTSIPSTAVSVSS